MANVLAVFAHPDDEVLGAGGTLAKHAEAGDDLKLIVMGRKEAFTSAAWRALGGTYYRLEVLPDQKFETWPLVRLVGFVEEERNRFDPDIIYTHHPEDLNLDHALTARAVLTAFRPKPGEKPRTILACEVLSSTEWTFPPAFQPNWYEALTGDQLERKIEAMRCYESELQEWPHPRSVLGIRNLAAFRGQSVGVERAEAFCLLRGGPF